MKARLLLGASLFAALALLADLVLFGVQPALSDPSQRLTNGIQDLGSTIRISVASDSSQANDYSCAPSISADGRYVAFSSYASNLVLDDTNGDSDTFVHDRQTGQTTRVSVASDGSQVYGNSWLPSISADGRYVAFVSVAGYLVPDDTNAKWDIFVHDRQTGQTTRVSVASDGSQANDNSRLASISADGRYVAFSSYASNLVPGDTENTRDVFVHDRQTGQTTRITSDGDYSSFPYPPAISADGRYVAFTSLSSNLVPDDTNESADIFVYDRQTGQTNRVSVASDGSQADSWSHRCSISADGRYVAFHSDAHNLVSGDTNDQGDVFVHDRQTGQTTRVSIASDGSQANGHPCYLSISADGRYVAFLSGASNLVPGDTNGQADIFVHDRQTGQTTRISLANDGSQANGESGELSISADGRYVAFDSWASNLVPGDTNGTSDVFVHDREGGGPMPAGLTYTGVRSLPSPYVMPEGEEVDGKITIGDHVHLLLPFENDTDQTLYDASVWFDGRSTNTAYPDVWIARTDDPATWQREMSYSLGDVPPHETVDADIQIYIDSYVPYFSRKSLNGAAILRLDYGQENRDFIGINLELIDFIPSDNEEMTVGDCLHHPFDFEIIRFAQYAAARPYGPQDPVSRDPDTPEDAVRNLALSISDSFSSAEGRDWFSPYRVPDVTLMTARGGIIGECRHYADLTIGLLRSLGIPARYITSLYFHPRMGSNLDWEIGSMHDWAEAYVNGSWRQVDSTWKSAFDEGYYERDKDWFFLAVWADQYPLGLACFDQCAPSCYQRPVKCNACLDQIQGYGLPWHANCHQSVRCHYHSCVLDGMEEITSASEEILVNAQAPIFVTSTVPFTLDVGLVNSTTQTLDVLTSTLSLYEGISSTLKLYDINPSHHIVYNLSPGEPITVTWTVTPLVAAIDLPLRVVAFTDSLLGLHVRSLVVNEPGTPLPLILRNLNEPTMMQPGQPLTFTAHALNEMLQPLTDTLTSITATVYATPSLGYSAAVPLITNPDGFFRQAITLPADCPLGTYMVDFAASHPGYDLAQGISAFFVAPSLTMTLEITPSTLSQYEPMTLAARVYERGATVTEANVRASVSTPSGVVDVPLIFGGGVYTATFRPVDLAPNLGGYVGGGQWQILAACRRGQISPQARSMIN